MTSAATSAQTLSFTYDALGRQLSEAGPVRTVSSGWDEAGRRQYVVADGHYAIRFAWLATGELSALQNGNFDPVVTFAYDDLGRRTATAAFDGTASSRSYDAIGRLTGLALDLPSSGNDVTFGYSYNPAGEIASNTRSNDAYSFTLANANVASTANGLNQLTAIGGASVTHDDNGNVSAIGAAGYGYDSENRLVSAPGGVTLGYDPLGRLYQVSDGTTTRLFLYDGAQLFGEYATNGAPLMFYEHGPGVDEPVMSFNYTTFEFGTFHGDERGSVAAVVAPGGTSINRYDDYGNPQGGAITGRFGYTGQVWLQQAGLYHYRARAYNPAMGRFMQADPIGYGGGSNLYAYVGNNPVNFTDPSGLDPDICEIDPDNCPVVEGRRFEQMDWVKGATSSWSHPPFFGPLDTGDGPSFTCPSSFQISQEGNNVTITGSIDVQNSLNNGVPWQPVTPQPAGTPVAPGLTDSLLGRFTLSFSGQFGSLNYTARFSNGSGGYTVYIGPRSGGETAGLGGRFMMIGSPAGSPGTPDFEWGFLNVATHGLGHGLGFLHNTIGLMSPNASGTRPTNSEMETSRPLLCSLDGTDLDMSTSIVLLFIALSASGQAPVASAAEPRTWCFDPIAPRSERMQEERSIEISVPTAGEVRRLPELLRRSVQTIGRGGRRREYFVRAGILAPPNLDQNCLYEMVRSISFRTFLDSSNGNLLTISFNSVAGSSQFYNVVLRVKSAFPIRQSFVSCYALD